MDLSLLTIPTMITFVLILTRISGIFVGAPVFGAGSVPNQVKIGVALVVALILFPIHATVETYEVPSNLIQFSMLAFQEFVIGILIGFVAELIFAGVRMSGEYLAVQMGMSISSVLDPMTGVQTPIIGQFYFIFAFLLFLILNVHHALIAALDRSFHWIPLGEGFHHWGILSQKFVMLGSEMFVVALLVAMPIMAVLMLTDTAMAFMAKVMPQMNIFIVGLPLKSAIGLLVVMVTLPFLASFLSDQYAELVQHLLGLYKGV